MTDGSSTSIGVGAAGDPTPAFGLRRITLLVGAGAFLDGFDLLIVNAALLSIIPAFGLTSGQVGLLTSLPFLGMVIGALVAGRLCDRFGRRRIYMIDIIAFVVLAVLLAVAQEYWQLLALRLLLGVAIGMDMPTGTSMLAEFAPPGRIGRLSAAMQTIWVAGGLVASVVGWTLFQLAGGTSWRWMFAAAAVPAIVIAIARHSLPESPRFARPRTAARPVRPGARGFREILQNRGFRRAVAFFTVYWTIESFLGGPPFVYTSVIFSQVVRLSPSRALLLSACLAAVYLAANLVGQLWALDRVGRKPLALGICAFAAVTAFATARLEGAGLALVIAFGLFAVATQVAPLPFWPWSVEQLPTRIRATGQSVGSAGGKLGQFIGLNIFTAGTIAGFGWAPYFVFVAVGFAVLAGIVAAFGRETKHADLDALDRV